MFKFCYRRCNVRNHKTPKTGLFGNPIPYSNYFEGPMDRLCDVDTNKNYSIIKISEELKE